VQIPALHVADLHLVFGGFEPNADTGTRVDRDLRYLAEQIDRRLSEILIGGAADVKRRSDRHVAHEVLRPDVEEYSVSTPDCGTVISEGPEGKPEPWSEVITVHVPKAPRVTERVGKPESVGKRSV